MLYTATWICLPRIFLGVHYASDICTGAIVGILAVMTCFKLRWFESNLVRRVVRIAGGKPEVFYPLAFLASLEMAVLFDDVRAAGSMVYRMLQVDFHLFVYTASVVAAIVGRCRSGALAIFPRAARI